MIKEIAFVCYPVQDMARARKFYEGVVGLISNAPLTENSEGMWVEYEIGPGAFALGKMDGFTPHKEAASLAFEVDDLDVYVKKLEEAGHKPVMGPMETPVCYMAMFLDTEGNAFMVHKRK